LTPNAWFGRKGAVTNATLDDVTKRINEETPAEEQLAADLVARAREQGGHQETAAAALAGAARTG
jgi:hypothetical protein